MAIVRVAIGVWGSDCPMRPGVAGEASRRLDR